MVKPQPSVSISLTCCHTTFAQLQSTVRWPATTCNHPYAKAEGLGGLNTHTVHNTLLMFRRSCWGTTWLHLLEILIWFQWLHRGSASASNRGFQVTSLCIMLGHMLPERRGTHLWKRANESDLLNGIICCESPLGTMLMKLKQLGDQIRICSADI